MAQRNFRKLRIMLDMSIQEAKFGKSKYFCIEHTNSKIPMALGENYITKNMVKLSANLPESYKGKMKLPLFFKNFETHEAMEKYLKTTKRHPVIIKTNNLVFNTKKASEAIMVNPATIFGALNTSLNLIKGLHVLKTFHPDAPKEEEAVAVAV